MSPYSFIQSGTDKLKRKPWLMVSLLALSITACGGGGDTSTVPDPSGSDKPPVITPPVVTPPVESPPENPPPVQELPEPELETLPDVKVAALPKAGAPSLPPPPASLRIPDSVLTMAVAQPLSVVSVTSSGDQNENNTAAKAADADLTSRWESAWGDDVSDADNAWIQFDFGVKTAVGKMTLHWENAHAAEYAIYISDDAQNWYQLRYVVDSKGKTEEFFNLNMYARYLRIQGIMVILYLRQNLQRLTAQTLCLNSTSLPSVIL